MQTVQTTCCCTGTEEEGRQAGEARSKGRSWLRAEDGVMG